MGKSSHRDDLAGHVNAGLSDPEIAALLGVSARTILRWRKQLGIASKWEPPKPTKHGTAPMYATGCRCEDCTQANTKRGHRARKARFQRVLVDGPPEGVRHGLSAALNWGCKCEVCTTAVRKRNKVLSDRAKAGNIKHVRGGWRQDCPCESCRVAKSKWAKARNDSSLESAHHHFYRWTGPELEIIARHDLTARQCAEMLGRTFAAVQNQRSRLNHADPKRVILLGAPSRTSVK